MESGLEAKIQETKNKIKQFLKEEGIEFNEDERHIMIKGEVFYIVMLRFVEISIKIKQDKYLVLTYENETLSIRYEETFPKENVKELKISRHSINAIYFTDKTLVILF